MRVTGPKGSSPISSKPKAGGSSASKGSFSMSEAARQSEAKAAQSSRALAAVDALISIQEVPDATARRAKAVKRAEDLLDLLDEIKIAILSGALPRARMSKLTRLIQDVRGDVSDEELSGVLDEIDLRAQVELAKLQKAA